MKRTKLIDRLLPDYTCGEEIFNMVSHIVGGGLGVFQSVVHCLQGTVAHQTGDFQRKLRKNLSVLYHNDTSVVPGNAVGGEGHVLIIDTHTDDIMAVMGHGGGHSTLLKAVALQIADADMTGIFMPLNDGHL